MSTELRLLFMVWVGYGFSRQCWQETNKCFNNYYYLCPAMVIVIFVEMFEPENFSIYYGINTRWLPASHEHSNDWWKGRVRA